MTFRVLLAAMLLGLVLAACTAGGAPTDNAATVNAANATVPPVQPTGPIEKVHWRALAAAGDDSAEVFDNAVDAMTQILTARGVARIDRFTSDPMVARADRQIATADSMAAALDAERPGPGEGCLVFLTSHGSRRGLLLRDDLDHGRSLDPSAFGRMLDDGCGKAPNRIILTAARDDRTSFGCGHEEQYTYFDDCLFRSWPQSPTWAALFRATEDCVRVKENKLGAVHSEPQAYFGAAVTNLALP